jgi:hypothetical protein
VSTLCGIKECAEKLYQCIADNGWSSFTILKECLKWFLQAHKKALQIKKLFPARQRPAGEIEDTGSYFFFCLISVRRLLL